MFQIKPMKEVDLKTKKYSTKEDCYQMRLYVQAAGLMVNFRALYLKPKRVLNTALHSMHSDVNSENLDRI